MRKMISAASILVLSILIANTVPTASVARAERSPAANYPPDLTSDIETSPSDYTSVSNIQAAFNNARTSENAQLSLSLPMLTLPAQAVWDAMSDNARALWLINRERIDRMGPSNPGLLPLQSAEANVTGMALSFAQYLFDNNAFDHDADGNDPWIRLNMNPVISDCHDFLSVAENLYAGVSTQDNLTNGVEHAIYEWMYNDSSSTWGHRHAILWYPYDDNSGTPGQEGFVGIGHVRSGPWSGFGDAWEFAVIVVMNVFDPCSTWQEPILSPRAFLPIALQGE